MSIPPPNVSRHTTFLDLSSKNLTFIPPWLTQFKQLEKLKLNKNSIKLDEPDIQTLLQSSTNLKYLSLHSNQIQSIPKQLESQLFSHLSKLEHLDLSNNQLENVIPITFCKSLKFLQLSGNKLDQIPSEITRLDSLEYLYLGYNKMTYISPALCRVKKLKLLALNNNKLTIIPPCIAHLDKLTTLNLHCNKIAFLPVQIVQNSVLREISLRGNPLVSKFVRSRLIAGLKHKPPTLFELACRSVKTYRIKYDKERMPEQIIDELERAVKCSNPRCSGVYFDTRYCQLKFVDCCGAYQLPLLQYLCSTNCIEDSEQSGSSATSASDHSQDEIDELARRVILG
jgi:hypothetical protein